MADTQFTIRRKVFTVFGAKFHIYNAEGGLLGFCKQKAFRLKEDIRVYTDESLSHERLLIKARNVIDFSAAYDVTDSKTQTRIGALRRHGMKSLLRDEWKVLDEDEREIGVIREESALLALVRRFVFNLVPQTYHLRDANGRDLAELHRHFNPFVHKLTVTIYPDCPLHPYLLLAGGVLLVAIEGRQK